MRLYDMSYNFTNCKPLDIKDIKNKQKLWSKYNKLLQHDKYTKDIEAWNPYITRKTTKIRFIRSHLRWSVYKNKEEFNRISKSTTEYFRVIQTFCYHGPVQKEYKNILLKFTECGSLREAQATSSPYIKLRQLYYYLEKNLPKMIKFVNTFDQEEEDTYVSRLN